MLFRSLKMSHWGSPLLTWNDNPGMKHACPTAPWSVREFNHTARMESEHMWKAHMWHQVLASWNKLRMAHVSLRVWKTLPLTKKFRKTFLSKSPVSTEKTPCVSLGGLKRKKMPSTILAGGQNYFHKWSTENQVTKKCIHWSMCIRCRQYNIQNSLNH